MQVLPELDTGGVERGTLEIAQALTKAGAQALVLSNGGRLVKQLTQGQAIHIQAPVHSKKPFQIYKNIGLIRTIIRNYNVDLVHVRSRAPAWSVYFACKKEKIPFISTFHGTYGHRGALGLKKFYNAIMLKGQCVIANSHFMADHLKRVYGVSTAFIRVIPRGVDTLLFDPIHATRAKQIKLRHAWGLTSVDINRPLLLLPGRLTRWKGQRQFIEALGILKDDLHMPDFTAVLVGSDQGREDYSAELRRLIQKYTLGDFVKIVDHCDDMAVAFSLAKFAISASIEPEAFGRVMIEAGAMERPVIATNHGGAREIVAEGTTGWLVNPRSPQIMAQALHKALKVSDKKYAQMAKAARKRVETFFSKERFTKKTLGVYKEVLQRPKP